MEKMRNISCTAVLLLCLPGVVWSSREEEHCTQTYETPTNLTCYVCPPGSFKRENCTMNNTGDLCQGCPANTYQNTCNIAENCEGCTAKCKTLFTIKVKDCTLYNDIVCECQTGFYWKNLTRKDGECNRHDLCKPSYGMVKRGNQYSNTVCKKCIAGETFSNESSLDGCKACTPCKEYKTNCTPESDAVCLIGNETETASIPTQTTEDCNPYKEATAILALFAFSTCILLIIVIVWAVRRLRGRNTTVEDGRQLQNWNFENQQNGLNGNDAERRHNPLNSPVNPNADEYTGETGNQNPANPRNGLDGNDDPGESTRETGNQNPANPQNGLNGNDDPGESTGETGNQNPANPRNGLDGNDDPGESTGNPQNNDQPFNTEEDVAQYDHSTDHTYTVSGEDEMNSTLDNKPLKDLTEEEMSQVIDNFTVEQSKDYLSVIFWKLKGKDFRELRKQIADICHHDKKRQLKMALSMLRLHQPQLKIADLVKGFHEPENAQENIDDSEECATIFPTTETLDISNKKPNAISSYSKDEEEETSNIIATEEGKSSTSQTWQNPVNHYRHSITEPTENKDHIDYISKEFASVHKKNTKSPTDDIKMANLKESNFTTQGLEEVGQSLTHTGHSDIDDETTASYV